MTAIIEFTILAPLMTSFAGSAEFMSSCGQRGRLTKADSILGRSNYWCLKRRPAAGVISRQGKGIAWRSGAGQAVCLTPSRAEAVRRFLQA